MPFGLLFKFGLPLLILAMAVAWIARLDNRRAHWHAKFDELNLQAGTVVLALRKATDNPDADWKSAPGQIIALGESNRTLKVQINFQNERVDQLAEEAVRLRAKASEMQAINERAQAQRRAAYAKLSDMANTPGERGDCMQLLTEANSALDTVRSAGI